MIKKICLLILLSFVSTAVLAEDIHLPEPNKTGKTTLMQALEDRHSDREFANKDVDDATLATILWSAYGVNREDGKRTIPTAKDTKDLNVYVFDKRGIWLYDADHNLLKQISDKDERKLFQLQDYMTSVPVVLVYTGSTSDYAAMHAGSAYQNVELFTAANGMASIVRGFFEQKQVAKILKLKKKQRVIISQAIGWKQ